MSIRTMILCLIMKSRRQRLFILNNLLLSLLLFRLALIASLTCLGKTCLQIKRTRFKLNHTIFQISTLLSQLLLNFWQLVLWWDFNNDRSLILINYWRVLFYSRLDLLEIIFKFNCQWMVMSEMDLADFNSFWVIYKTWWKVSGYLITDSRIMKSWSGNSCKFLIKTSSKLQVSPVVLGV